MVEFTDRNGNILSGKIIHQYNAFEGGKRYIIQTSSGKEYRCIIENGIYKEYVA